jgi:hypothetical protein
MGDSGGGTLDTVSGQLVTSASYAVALRPGTLRTVSAEEFAARGPEILREVMDSDPIFRDGRVRLGTERVTVDGAEVVRIDPSIDSWSADPSVATSMYRPLSKQQAILIAKALGQDQVWDFKAGASIPTKVDPRVQNLTSHFVDLSLSRGSQFKRWTEYLDQFYRDHVRAAEEAGRAPDLHPDDVAAQIQMDMVAAYGWAIAHKKVSPDGIPTKAGLDEYFKHKTIEFSAAKNPRTRYPGDFEGHQLNQVMLNLDIQDPAVHEWIKKTTPDYEEKVAWYDRSHAGIEKHFRGKEVTLGDGSVIDAADLMYQLIAVTSIQTTPQTNLGFALSSFNNWKEFRNGQGAMHKQFARNINKFLKLPADARTNEALINTIMEGVPHGERTGSELAQGMGRSSGIFARKGDHLKAITSILSGHTLDKWNADTVANLNVPWGGKSKGEVQKMLDAIPPDVWEQAKQENAAFPGASVEQRAMALHYGSSAWGKILSFWQNLADPANSRAVTLDVWMARAFGMQSWDKVGDYAEFTRRVTQAADAAGISPHALQALIWAHAKEEITRQGTQRAFGATSQARDILDQGGRLGAPNDPVLQQFDYEVSRDAEWQKEKAAAAASGGPAPKKGRIDKITATTAPTHGGPVGTEEMLYQRPTAGQDIAQVEKSRQLYLDTAKKVNTLMDEGKTVEAQHELAKWATRYAKAEKAGEDASDFLHKLDNPTGGVETQIKRGQMLDLADLTADGKFAEDIVAKVLGFTRVTDNAQRMLIRLFQGGDVETLVHENLHVLRQILTPEDIRTVENAIGAPGVFSTKLTDKAGMVRRTQAEELFVREFLGHLYSGQAPSPALQPIFDRLNNGLRDRHTIGDRYGNLTVLDPGALDSVWDKYLDPALPEQRLASGLDRMGQESARISDPTLSPEQLTAQNTPLPGETAGGAVRRQRAMSRALERKHMLEARASDRLKRVARLQKAKSDMERTLTDHATPAEQQVEKISRLIGKVGDKLEASMLDPKTSQVPPVWQPLKQTMDALWKEAENDPVLAQHMEGLPKTFGDILQLAAQKGFDPTHVRSFTPNQVERLVHETIRLGAPGKSAGEEIIAGTRKPRVSGNPRTQSLDALVAATIEATHETQSNELVTFIEKNYSIPYNGAIPHGYEAWDPIKRTFVNRRETLPSGINKTQSPEPTMLIPSAVARTLRHMTKDFSHSAFKFLGKPSSWWRTYLLTLTPRWYVNNFVGNFALAEAEGVNMKDWLSALKSYRQRSGKTFGLRAPRENVPFNDMPGVTGASVYHELENTTLTPPSPGVRGLLSDVKNTPGINARWLRIKHSLARGNEVVDEIARAAVYHHTVRTTGSAEMALQRSYAALVDYGDLGPFERSIVRSIVPFYAWQKGILKVVVRLGIEHPGAFALMQRLSDLQEEKLQDQYGVKLPPGYQGLMDIPGIGTVNTRGMNPFADAGQLVRSGGIGESINPFVESLVRNELNAPQTTRPEDYRLNQFGTMVPETNVPQDITETFSSGLPQGQLLGNLTGNSPYAVPPGVAQSLERFGGLNALSKADLARIVARMTANDATLNGTKVARKARKKSDFLKPFLDLTNK